MDILQTHLAHNAERESTSRRTASSSTSYRGNASTTMQGLLNNGIPTTARNPSRQLPQERFVENERRYGATRRKQLEDERRKSARTDMDYLLEHHQFVRDAAPSDLETWAKELAKSTEAQKLGAAEDEKRTTTMAKKKKKRSGDADWAKAMAANYDRHLFKEYALADMSRYKRGQVGLRWRTEKEVVSGKGESECANLHCAESHGLAAFEVNFAYMEGNPPVRKNTLVKLMLCPDCGYKLNYKKLREKEAERKKREKKDKKKRSKERKKQKKRKRHHKKKKALKSNNKSKHDGAVRSTSSADSGASDDIEGAAPSEAVSRRKRVRKKKGHRKRARDTTSSSCSSSAATTDSESSRGEDAAADITQGQGK